MDGTDRLAAIDEALDAARWMRSALSGAAGSLSRARARNVLGPFGPDQDDLWTMRASQGKREALDHAERQLRRSRSHARRLVNALEALGWATPEGVTQRPNATSDRVDQAILVAEHVAGYMVGFLRDASLIKRRREFVDDVFASLTRLIDSLLAERDVVVATLREAAALEPDRAHSPLRRVPVDRRLRKKIPWLEIGLAATCMLLIAFGPWSSREDDTVDWDAADARFRETVGRFEAAWPRRGFSPVESFLESADADRRAYRRSMFEQRGWITSRPPIRRAEVSGETRSRRVTYDVGHHQMVVNWTHANDTWSITSMSLP